MRHAASSPGCQTEKKACCCLGAASSLFQLGLYCLDGCKDKENQLGSKRNSPCLQLGLVWVTNVPFSAVS